MSAAALPVMPTRRRRERTAIRAARTGVEVLPPDIGTKVSALQPLAVQERTAAVSAMLAHFRGMLPEADLSQIVECKAKAAAIRDIAKQLQLGKDLKLDATEFVLRTERALGVAIREGQRLGTVIKSGDVGGGGRHGDAAKTSRLSQCNHLQRPTDFAAKYELSALYALASTTDEHFEVLLSECREEGNLSRRNLLRKLRTPPTPEPDTSEPSKPVRKTAAARKVMEDLSITMNSLVFIVNDTDPAEVDGRKHKEDIYSIRQGMTAIRQFLNAIQEEGNY